MLFTIVSIDAVNEDLYEQARRECPDIPDALDFVEECHHLKRFSDGDYLGSMLPSGYRLPSADEKFTYDIFLRCLIEGGDEFLLRLTSVPPKHPTPHTVGFDPVFGRLVVYERVDSKEQVAQILDRYWPTISEWRKSLIVHAR